MREHIEFFQSLLGDSGVLLGDEDVLVRGGAGRQATVTQKTISSAAANQPTALESLFDTIVPICLLWHYWDAIWHGIPNLNRTCLYERFSTMRLLPAIIDLMVRLYH